MRRLIRTWMLPVLLVLCLTAAGSLAAAAAETATEAATEAASAADTGASAATQSDGVAGMYEQYFTQIEQSAASLLANLSGMTDEQLEAYEESDDETTRMIAAKWASVKQELGNFVEVTDQTAEMTEDYVIHTVSTVNYDGVGDNTKVTFDYDYDLTDNTIAIEWNVEKSKALLLKEAGLNTLLGLGTVFAVLAFLTFLIGQIHWIPDLIEKKQKEKQAATEALKAAPVRTAAPEPAAAAAAAAAAPAETAVDDTELIAVIAAAIAASEQTDPGSFVVRSIRRVRK